MRSAYSSPNQQLTRRVQVFVFDRRRLRSHRCPQCARSVISLHLHAPSPQQSHALCLPEFSKVFTVSITPIAKSSKPYLYFAHKLSRALRSRELRVTRCSVRTINARVESRAAKPNVVDSERRTLAAHAIGDFLLWDNRASPKSQRCLSFLNLSTSKYRAYTVDRCPNYSYIT